MTHTDDRISVDGKSFHVFETKDPAQIDWSSVGAQIVVESTGLFTQGPDARKHIRGTVKKVIISAPATDRGPTRGAGREREDLRSGEAPRHFERFVHDELPGAGGEGAAGQLRNS